MFKKFLLPCISILIILSALEIGVRVVTGMGAFVQDDPYIARRYVENLDRIIRADGGSTAHFKTNKYGFIGTDWDEKKMPGTLRIANLGDSFTAGNDVDFDKTYTVQTTALLTGSTSVPTEGLNFGVAGQGTGHVLATYEHYARNFDPDIVIYWFFLGNDFEENLIHDEGSEDGSDEHSSWIKRQARKSQLALLIVNKLARIPILQPLLTGRILTRIGQDTTHDTYGLPLELRLLFTEDKENAMALQKTKQYLTGLRNAVSADSRMLFVVMIPTHFQVEQKYQDGLLKQYPALSDMSFDPLRPNRELASLLGELSIDFIDLTPHLAEACAGSRGPFCSYYECPHCHLSLDGHRFTSEIVARALLENKHYPLNKEKREVSR